MLIFHITALAVILGLIGYALKKGVPPTADIWVIYALFIVAQIDGIWREIRRRK